MRASEKPCSIVALEPGLQGLKERVEDEPQGFLAAPVAQAAIWQAPVPQQQEALPGAGMDAVRAAGTGTRRTLPDHNPVSIPTTTMKASIRSNIVVSLYNMVWSRASFTPCPVK
jgi:hypothetical protein